MQSEPIQCQATSAAEPSPFAVLAARILLEVFPRLLGLLFIYVAYQKYHAFGNLYEVLAFDGVPDGLIYPLGYTVLGVEFVLGLMLLQFYVLRKPTIIASTILLVLYTAQIGYLVMFTDAPDCGCLGAQEGYEAAQHSNLLSLARNACLLIPCAWTWLQLPSKAKHAAGRGFEVA